MGHIATGSSRAVKDAAKSYHARVTSIMQRPRAVEKISGYFLSCKGHKRELRAKKISAPE